jgi:hypothetical protein
MTSDTVLLCIAGLGCFIIWWFILGVLTRLSKQSKMTHLKGDKFIEWISKSH